MLEQVLRDEGQVPALAEVMVPFHAYLREMKGLLAAGWGVGGAAQRRLQAAVGHAIRFHSWRSLSEEGLEDREAAALMAELVGGVARAGA